MKENLSIVIPAYNESGSIAGVLENISRFVKENKLNVIVVNDGSTDATLDALTSFILSNPDYPLQVINHSVNRGYGGALKSGMRHVITRYLVTIDADGQHHVEDIATLYHQLCDEKADMCIGNRNFQGSSLSRNLIKRLVLYFVKKSTGIKVNDLNSGMKLYKTDIVQSLLKYAPNGMPFSDAIVLLHHQFRYKITESPIQISERRNGESTINYKTAVYTIAEVANMIINFFPFKFFFYIAVILFSFAVVWGTPLILSGNGLSTGTSFLLLASLNFSFFGIILENIVRSRFEDYTYKKSQDLDSP
jgi:glycosyltransferase involved in cell wall biosynthesis